MTYNVLVNGDTRMTFEADFAQASDPILLNGSSTPFQVADARHEPIRAARMLNDWCRAEGGEAWGEEEEFEVVREGD